MEKNKNENKVWVSFFKGLKNVIVKLGLWIFHKIVNVILDVKRNPKNTAKRVICLAAILHLILSNIQIKTLTVLDNQICGFVMFMFILIGLACMFNAIRFKDITVRKIIFSLFMLCLVIGLGGWLAYIYIYSIRNQHLLEAKEVMPGLTLTIIMMAIYLFGMIETIFAVIIARKNGQIGEPTE